MVRVLASCFVHLAAAADEDCVPQYSPFPRSCVDCSAGVNPQYVPAEVSKLWGVWYTIASETNAHDPNLVCTQLNFAPKNADDLYSDVEYLASYNKGGSPSGEHVDAAGLFTPTSDDFTVPRQAPYQLEIPVGMGIPAQDFFFVASDGDRHGEGISAVVTYSCPKDGKNSQMFLLSRTPSFASATTRATLEERARAAMSNFDAHDFSLIDQPVACEYSYNSFSALV